MNRNDLGRCHYALLAATLVVSGWLAATFVLNVGGSLPLVIRADATVAPSPSDAAGEPGTVAITWTENADRPEERGPLSRTEPTHAEYLTVEWAAATGYGTVETLDTGRAERNVTVVDGTWRLAATGHSVTLRERNATAATVVRVMVTAHREDAATVVVATTVTV